MNRFLFATIATLAFLPASLAAQVEGEVDRADLFISCEGYRLILEGQLLTSLQGVQPLGGDTAIVDYRILLTPADPNESPVRIEESIEVTGDLNNRFTTVVDLPFDEKVCGWYETAGTAGINGNETDIDVLDPAGGLLDCCCSEIGDFVWEDLNRNGVQDPDEPGIAGVRVTLTGITFGGNRVELERVTNEDGRYRFTDLCPGTYGVDIDESTLPAGFFATEPNVGDDNLDSDGPLDGGFVEVEIPKVFKSINASIDFGYEREVVCTGAIGNYIWKDIDDDGIQDLDNFGVPGVEMLLFDDAGNLLNTDDADLNGAYVFKGLCAGSYTVEPDPSTVPTNLGPTLANVGTDDAIDSDGDRSAVVLGTDEEENLDSDFGYGQCGDCAGGVTDLSMAYRGDEAALVEVRDGDDVLFAAVVQPDDVFTVSSGDAATPLGDLDLLVDGELDVDDLDMSCSQPIGPGLIFGAFEAIAARSKDNLLVCPLTSCDATRGDFQIENDRVLLEIQNDGDQVLTVQTVAIAWPMSNGKVTEILLDGMISQGDFLPPSAIVEEFDGDLSRRQIEPGERQGLRVEFDRQPIDSSPEGYALAVKFVGGCSVVYVPRHE